MGEFKKIKYMFEQNKKKLNEEMQQSKIDLENILFWERIRIYGKERKLREEMKLTKKKHESDMTNIQKENSLEVQTVIEKFESKKAELIQGQSMEIESLHLFYKANQKDLEKKF